MRYDEEDYFFFVDRMATLIAGRARSVHCRGRRRPRAGSGRARDDRLRRPRAGRRRVRPALPPSCAKAASTRRSSGAWRRSSLLRPAAVRPGPRRDDTTATFKIDEDPAQEGRRRSRRPGRADCTSGKTTVTCRSRRSSGRTSKRAAGGSERAHPTSALPGAILRRRRPVAVRRCRCSRRAAVIRQPAAWPGR